MKLGRSHDYFWVLLNSLQEYSVLWTGTARKSDFILRCDHWSWRSWKSYSIYAFEVRNRQTSSCGFLIRHDVATREAVGTLKALCLKKHFLTIFPECHIDAKVLLYDSSSEEEILSGNPHFVLDCIKILTLSWVIVLPCGSRNLRKPFKLELAINIAECYRGFGADVIMTSESCRNGIEHCNEAHQKLGTIKCVVDNRGYAIHFSQGLIPFNKFGTVNPEFLYLLHLEIQGFACNMHSC
ncbi:unnamed protein product [Fraxinus pennsylvanica]|uniref:Uncharacterized protein n=1 Tax=Fraxinus pennsylvanica TaxID=56036 RepID=A0AAD2AFD2_9LAMI|nr:unnamed protein product [Fraxinus pennsylvanica]